MLRQEQHHVGLRASLSQRWRNTATRIFHRLRSDSHAKVFICQWSFKLAWVTKFYLKVSFLRYQGTFEANINGNLSCHFYFQYVDYVQLRCHVVLNCLQWLWFCVLMWHVLSMIWQFSPGFCNAECFSCCNMHLRCCHPHDLPRNLIVRRSLIQ